MLEFLQARFDLAKSRILKSIDPKLSEDMHVLSHELTYSIGFNNPDLEPGALVTDEPDLLATFHEGVGTHYYWQQQIDLDYKQVDYL